MIKDLYNLLNIYNDIVKELGHNIAQNDENNILINWELFDKNSFLIDFLMIIKIMKKRIKELGIIILISMSILIIMIMNWGMPYMIKLKYKTLIYFLIFISILIN